MPEPRLGSNLRNLACSKFAASALTAVLLLAALALPAAAGNPPPSGGEFTIRRSTIDAGAGDSAGADFVLKGTIGQHDTQIMAGGEFDLRGGFWTPAGPSDFLFRNGFES
ncbi:MAG: hypothetical protein ACNS61_06625 [Candidatus Wenzhouxiangella sp. M2_3B_020]